MADLRTLRERDTYQTNDLSMATERQSTHQENCQRLEKLLLELGSTIDRIAVPVPREKFDFDAEGFGAAIARCLVLTEALKKRMSDIAERLGHE